MMTRVEHKARPIFIVSPGRSGSTILTWCLGQHPDILPQEESNWLGPFAIDAAAAHRLGSIRGERGQLSANFVERDELLATLGDSIDGLMLSHRAKFENVTLRQRAGWSSPPFPISRSADEPKSRWVDGTPEYSFYICGLRKLFPYARFIHLVRDVTEVVRSLLNFRPYGKPLVPNEQAAYGYWFRRANACFEAEQAYGAEIMRRFRYSDLVNQPDLTMGCILDFVGEPFSPQCLEPLSQRINSSNVPADFQSADPRTDPSVVKQAQTLSEELQNSPQQEQPAPEWTAKLETEFNQRVASAFDAKL